MLYLGSGSQHTLSHEVFEVMPFDVVGEITDVDTTILLRRITYVRHHLLLGLGRALRKT